MIRINSGIIPAPQRSANNDSSEQEQKTEYIQFPHNDHTLLYSFFRYLEGLKDTARLIRVLHFGGTYKLKGTG